MSKAEKGMLGDIDLFLFSISWCGQKILCGVDGDVGYAKDALSCPQTLRRWPVLLWVPPFVSFLFFCALAKFCLPGSQLLRVTWTLWAPPSSPTRPQSPHFFQFVLFLYKCIVKSYRSVLWIGEPSPRWRPAASFPSERSITTQIPGKAVWKCSERGGSQEREVGGEEERKRGWEVLEHCSADKLMQQSRLTQQHTPNLADCLHEQPGNTGSPAQKKTNKQNKHQNKDISS